MVSISSSSQINPYRFNRREFGHYYMSGNQTTNINAGDPIKFNSCAIGNIAFNGATYTWTLKAGKTYKLMAELQIGTDQASAYLCAQWRTTAGVDIGNSSQTFPLTYTSNTGPVQMAVAIYTPTVDTDVRCCIDLISHVTTIYGGAFATAGAAYAEIEEIESAAPLRIDGQYEYVSKQIALSVTSGAAGFALGKAVGVFKKTSDGKWYLHLNIVFAITSGTNADFTIASVTWPSVHQTVAAWNAGNNVVTCQFNANGAGTVTLRSDANNATYYLSGEVELAGKPTIAGIPSDV